MNPLAKYAFTNARVRAMLSSLLTESQLNALTGAKDIDELLLVLKSTPYEAIFKKLATAHEPKMIELELFRDGIEKYNKILKNLKGRSGEVVFLLLSKYELTNLKNLLRIWHTRAGEEEIKYLYKEKICYDIPLLEILASKTIEEIILLLERTPYKNALMNGKARFKEKGSIFYLEIALDIDYYKRLWNKIEAMDLMDRRLAFRLIGIEVDIENISWVVRFKEYYKMPLGELVSYVIPGGYQIAEPLIRKVYSLEDIRAVITGLSTKPYQDMATLVSGTYDRSKVFMLEAILWQVLLKEARSALGKFPFTIATVIAYLILYRAEARNIVSLLYSKLYQLDPERIRGSLIC